MRADDAILPRGEREGPLRTATITLILTLIAPSVLPGQAGQTPAEEFTLSAFILALHIPGNVSNAEGTSVTSGPVLWVAVKNRTAIPYSLCTNDCRTRNGGGSSLVRTGLPKRSGAAHQTGNVVSHWRNDCVLDGHSSRCQGDEADRD